MEDTIDTKDHFILAYNKGGMINMMDHLGKEIISNRKLVITIIMLAIIFLMRLIKWEMKLVRNKKEGFINISRILNQS